MNGLIWPKVPAGFVRAMLAGHSSLGLVFAALCYMLCVTGTVAVLSTELRRWEQPGPPEYTALAPGALDRAADQALAVAGDKEPHAVTVYLPIEDRPRAIVWLSGEGLDRGWFVDREGRIAQPDEPYWNHFVADLHAHLHIEGKAGYILVGVAGVAMLGLAISGLLAHPRIFRDAFRLRWGGSRRLQEADLHNRLSVWGLPFNVIVSATGAYIGLVSSLLLILGAVAPGSDAAEAGKTVRAPQVAEDNRPAPRLSLEAAVAQAERLGPGQRPFSITLEHPGTMGQHLEIYSAVPKRVVWGELYAAGPNGVLKRIGWASGDFGVQLYASSYRLHFGNFAGLPVKVLYVVLGFALSAVTAGGVSIWIARRRDQGRPAPRWERIWLATAWGQLAALPLCAVDRFAFDREPVAAYVLVQAAAWAAALVVKDTGRLLFGLKAATGAALVLAVAAHVIRHGADALRPLPLAINAVLLLSGLAILAYLALRRTRGGELRRAAVGAH